MRVSRGQANPGVPFWVWVTQSSERPNGGWSPYAVRRRFTHLNSTIRTRESSVVERTRASQLVLVTCLFLSGCGSRLTADRFDKVKEGMTLSQVKSILGKPHGVVKTGPNAQMLGWESGNAIVNVMMANGKVFAKNQENLP